MEFHDVGYSLTGILLLYWYRTDVPVSLIQLFHVPLGFNPLKTNVLYTGQTEQKDSFAKKVKTIGIQLTKEKDFDL